MYYYKEHKNLPLAALACQSQHLANFHRTKSTAIIVVKYALIKDMLLMALMTFNQFD
jgi:hypothetical protein